MTGAWDDAAVLAAVRAELRRSVLFCSVCGRPARGDGAATSPATGAVVHWCRQCSVEHCALDRYLLTRRGDRE